MSLDLTTDGINEFYDVIHGIDNSLVNIHDSLEVIVDILGQVAEHLEAISNNLSHSNSKED